jgi:hypothetical protein
MKWRSTCDKSTNSHSSSSSVGLQRLMPPDVPQPFRLTVLTLLWKFTLAPPGILTSPTTRETSSRERGTVGEKCPVILPTNGDFHAKCRDLLHAANLQHGADGFTSPPKAGTLRIFLPWKIRWLQPGSNQRPVYKPLDPRSHKLSFVWGRNLL